MKTGFLAPFLMLFFFSSKAQLSKAIYAELGGPGLASVNYDMRFTQSDDGIGGRIGIGGFMIRDDENERISLLTVPFGVNYLIGKDGKNYFEVGAGYTYIKLGAKGASESSTLESSFGNLTLGYRLAPSDGGFMFKAQITPVFSSHTFMPYYGGLGFGYKF